MSSDGESEETFYFREDDRKTKQSNENKTGKQVIDELLHLLNEYEVETSTRKGIPIYDVRSKYTVRMCVETIRTSQRLLLDEMLLMERVVANHKTTNRLEFIKNLEKNKKSLYNNPYKNKKEKVESGEDGYERFKLLMGSSFTIGGDK